MKAMVSKLSTVMYDCTSRKEPFFQNFSVLSVTTEMRALGAQSG